MKKAINIFFTVIGSLAVLLFLIESIFGETKMNDLKIHNIIDILQGVGVLFLGIVTISMSIFVFMMIVLVPVIFYRLFRSNDSDFEFIKEWVKYILIFLAGISLFSIAGVQLRNLKQFTDEPTIVRVVDPSFVRVLESNGKPKFLEDHFFYYNDSIKDWVLTSKIDYVKKKQKLSHLLYSVKSETKKYRKSTLGNWLEVNDMGFNAAKSAGLQTLEYIPKPCVNYFLFTSNDWKKITKDEFFKYRDLDSIVRYE
jgi:hypothetical protein